MGERSTETLADLLDEAVADALTDIARHVDRHDALVDLRTIAAEEHVASLDDLFAQAGTTIDRARLMALYRRITDNPTDHNKEK